MEGLYLPFLPEAAPDAWISQEFGANPAVYARWGLRGHNGLDFAVGLGTALRTVDGCELIETGWDAGGYGHYAKWLIVEGVRAGGHWLYAHLAEPVDDLIGSRFGRGDVFSRSGSTGFSTGPHLHLGHRRPGYDRGDGMLGYSDPRPALAAIWLEVESPAPEDPCAAVRSDRDYNFQLKQTMEARLRELVPPAEVEALIASVPR